MPDPELRTQATPFDPLNTCDLPTPSSTISIIPRQYGPDPISTVILTLAKPSCAHRD